MSKDQGYVKIMMLLARLRSRAGAELAPGRMRRMRRALSGPPPRKVNLEASFRKIAEPWDPRVAANVNNFQVKLVRMEGEFVWHSHADEDEVFLVTAGTMRMKLRDGDVDVGPGEIITVPRGVEHCPSSLTPHCDVVLLEPATTLNTGDFADEEFVHPSSTEGLALRKDELKSAE